MEGDTISERRLSISGVAPLLVSLGGLTEARWLAQSWHGGRCQLEGKLEGKLDAEQEAAAVKEGSAHTQHSWMDYVGRYGTAEDGI